MTHKDFATKIAHQAGAIIKKYFFGKFEVEYKEHQSHVTVADREINTLVAKAVAQEFPKHGFIGEEGGGFNQKAEYVWVCDPLDGTLLFVAGIPNVAFSLALVRNGQPILGVIYHPFSERLYIGEKDKGARMNGTAVHVNTTSTLSSSLVGIFAWNKARYDFTGVLTELIKNSGANFQTGSAAYLGALVASGEAVGNLFPHTTPWDVAAQKIIVEEAGGKTSDLFGNGQRYDRDTKGFIASNGIVHDQLVEIIGKMVKIL